MDQPATDGKVTTAGVTGYRPLSDAEIELMNEIKAKGTEVGDLIDKAVAKGADARWASIARTDLQKAFMCLTRAVAKPTSF